MRSSAWALAVRKMTGMFWVRLSRRSSLQYAVSVHARHHLVQQDQFRLVPARHFQRGQAVIGRQGRMARTFQIISHKI